MKIYEPTRRMLEHIATAGPSTKQGLAVAFGLAVTSVNCHVNKLVKLGYLKRSGKGERIATHGPSPTAYTLTPMARGVLIEVPTVREAPRMSADETVRRALRSQPNSIFNIGVM